MSTTQKKVKMSYSDLPPELILHIASFLAADNDGGLWCAIYPEPYPCLAWLNAWIQTSKFHAILLTPQLYDRCLQFSPRRQTTEGYEKSRQECRWFTSIMKPCPIDDKLLQAARHWKSDILVSYLLGRIHQGLRLLGEHQEICLLTFMVKARNVAMLETLIELGNLRGRLPELGHLWTVTPLCAAISLDDLAAMRVLLDAGADINQRGPYGLLPLHVAAQDGKSTEAVDLLIRAGADVWTTSTGWGQAYPVQIAMCKLNKHCYIARRLLGAMLETENRAADPGWKNELLHTAVLYSQCDSVGITQTLVDNGADVFSRSSLLEDRTAIELAASLEMQYISDDAKICEGHRRLRNTAAALFQADPHLWPLGHINRQLWECMRGVDCVEGGQIRLFGLLIESGESALDVAGPDGYTALHYLCNRDYLSGPDHCICTHDPAGMRRMVSLLLDNGASVVTRCSFGQSPLSLAAQCPCPKFLSLFLEKRPNCLTEDNALHTDMDIRPARKVPLCAAIQTGGLERVQTLLNHGADISIVDRNGCNAICNALRMSPIDTSIIKVLIEATLAVPEHRRRWGHSLAHAIETRNREAIDMLLEAEACPYQKTIFGLTALKCAAIHRDMEALERLVQRWGRDLVQSDDSPSGSLVCALLSKKDYAPMSRRRVNKRESGAASLRRVPELMKIVKSLVDNGAVVHQNCHVCESWNEELGVQLAMVY